MRSLRPRITVVTPSFNQAEYLEETICSVLGQEYPNLDFIIIDGGSTDGSLDIIHRYHSQITHWVSEPDAGQTAAINKGFTLASGDILTWLNSDDCLYPGALRQVAEYFMSNPHYGAVIGDLEIIDREGKLVDFKPAVPINCSLAIYSGSAVPQPSTFFTRCAWLQTGPLDSTLHYYMDLEYFVRMLRKGIRFGTLNRPLAKFRLHGKSKTVTRCCDLAAEQRLIQRRYGNIRRREDGWGTFRLKTLKFAARFVLWGERLFLRGHVLPFRGGWARMRCAQTQHFTNRGIQLR